MAARVIKQSRNSRKKNLGRRKEGFLSFGDRSTYVVKYLSQVVCFFPIRQPNATLSPPSSPHLPSLDHSVAGIKRHRPSHNGRPRRWSEFPSQVFIQQSASICFFKAQDAVGLMCVQDRLKLTSEFMSNPRLILKSCFCII